MEENGDVKEQYEIANSESAWAEFRDRYSHGNEMALEVSTSGKYVARKARKLMASGKTRRTLKRISRIRHADMDELLSYMNGIINQMLG